LLNFTPESRQQIDDVSLNDPKFGDVYPCVSSSPTEFFAHWIVNGGDQGDPGASFYHMENTYWGSRHDANMLLVHYNDLMLDRGGEMRRIAAYLGIEVSEFLWPALIEAAGFNAMKANGDALLPHAQHTWNGGSSRFLNKGTTGQWQNVLSADLVARYTEAIEQYCPSDLACWLQRGRLGAEVSLESDPITTA
jgi:aryl sulfotransferase